MKNMHKSAAAIICLLYPDRQGLVIGGLGSGYDQGLVNGLHDQITGQPLVDQDLESAHEFGAVLEELFISRAQVV